MHLLEGLSTTERHVNSSVCGLQVRDLGFYHLGGGVNKFQGEKGMHRSLGGPRNSL